MCDLAWNLQEEGNISKKHSFVWTEMLFSWPKSKFGSSNWCIFVAPPVRVAMEKKGYHQAGEIYCICIILKDKYHIPCFEKRYNHFDFIKMKQQVINDAKTYWRLSCWHLQLRNAIAKEA